MKFKKFHLLGSGASTGVPMIGCTCHVCTSTDARNQRLRTSAILECDEGCYLIDPGPDFRMQALRFGLESHGKQALKGVFITHTHSDHIAGIDDLRVFNFKQQRPIPVLLSQDSYSDLSKRYSYMTHPQEDLELKRSKSASLDCRVLPASEGKGHFEGIDFDYCTYVQGDMPVLGFRFGALAYVTDIKHYDDGLLKLVKDAKWLLISAGAQDMSRMHLQLHEAIELAQACNVEKTIFIHLNHDFDFLHWQNQLPTGMSLGYDGLKIDLLSQA